MEAIYYVYKLIRPLPLHTKTFFMWVMSFADDVDDRLTIFFF